MSELRNAEAPESREEHASDRASSLLQALPQGNNNQHTTEPEPRARARMIRKRERLALAFCFGENINTNNIINKMPRTTKTAV